MTDQKREEAEGEKRKNDQNPANNVCMYTFHNQKLKLMPVVFTASFFPYRITMKELRFGWLIGSLFPTFSI